MKLIPLTQGKLAQVDDADYDWLNQWKWYYLSSGYAARDIIVNHKKTCILMHVAISREMGFSSPDHKNRNRLDNRRENLRPASRAQQRQNTGLRSDNISGYKGVSWKASRKRWTADITVAGKHIYLKSCRTPEEAAKHYDVAALKYFGEFANLNFPQTPKQKVKIAET